MRKTCNLLNRAMQAIKADRIDQTQKSADAVLSVVQIRKEICNRRYLTDNTPKTETSSESALCFQCVVTDLSPIYMKQEREEQNRDKQ